MRIVLCCVAFFLMSLFFPRQLDLHQWKVSTAISCRRMQIVPRPSISLPVRPTLNASSASPNNVKKGSDSASKAIVAPSSPRKDDERQKRLDALLRDLYNRQLHISSSDTIIVYDVLRNCGFGNMIRGYFTSMLLVLFYDAAFKGRACRLVSWSSE